MRGLALLIGLAACVEPSFVTCPGLDLVCSPGTVCDLTHHTCVAPEQLVSCIGLSNGATCELAGGAGYCADEVCLPIVCGNGVVDPGEVCDDGNFDSGDGCSSTCSSAEICGNGVRDALLGETCDDGNHLDGDGCDSRCRSEQETWTVTGADLLGNGQGHTAYDATHHQMLHVSQGITWSWDGTRWSVIDTSLPHANSLWTQVTYDPDLHAAVYVGRTNGSQTIDQVWSWSGMTWVRSTSIAPPQLDDGLVAYDPARHVVDVIGRDTLATVALWTLDLATGAWTARPPPTTTLFIGSTTSGFAFDAVRNVTVFATGTKVYEWNGTVWATITATTPAPQDWALTFDPRLGAVILVGGSGPSNIIARWTGAAWVTIPAETLPSPRSHVDVAYDTDRQRRVVFGGSDLGTTSYDDTYEWSGTQWFHIASGAPPEHDNGGLLRYTFDVRAGEMVQFGGAVMNGIDTWAWKDHRWHQLPPAPVTAAYPEALAYDPVRGGSVVNNDDQSTWMLRDEAWTQLEPAGTSAPLGISALVYDPLEHALVGTDGYTLWRLPSAAIHWEIVGPPPPGGSNPTIAFDASTGHLVAVTNTNVYEYDGTTWQQTLSPGLGYQVVADTRRGTVDFVWSIGSTWERASGAWFEHAPLAFEMQMGVTFAPVPGTLIVIGDVYDSRVILERTFVGVSPREACAGADEDGDGLVDCADPDCWWSCAPACPPRTSCP